MADRVVRVVLGIVAVVVGLGLLLAGFGLPVTFCVSGTGMAETCTTDSGALALAVGMMLGGLVSAGLGGRTVYRAL